MLMGTELLRQVFLSSVSILFVSPFKSDPPPVNITPLSTISAANSGGVFSKTLIETLTIFLILSSRALAVSS